jgi:hypothetical protein
MKAMDSEAGDAGALRARGAARSMIEGAIRFALVSLGGFAVWAFAGGWFYRNTGEAGLYAASTVVFIGLAGWLLHPLVAGPRPVVRLLGVFVPAFLAYAVVWCAFWFVLGFGAGEWLGSLAGSVAFVGVAGWRFGNLRPVVKASLVFFAAHSAGYFAGGELMEVMSGEGAREWIGGLSREAQGALAKLSWGLLYGMGVGAGLGYAFHALLFVRADEKRAR